MRIKILFIILIVFLLTGCESYPSEVVFRVPELPREYVEFNNQLSSIIDSGSEYVSPTSGQNRQSVQLADLDNDGVDEGIAFFRKTSGSLDLSVYIFKKTNNGYKQLGIINGAGNTIESVTYADLKGDGSREIIIGWGVTDSDVHVMTVNEINSEGITALFKAPYSYFALSDMNGDGINDILTFGQDDNLNTSKITLYTYKNDSINKVSDALLSANVSDIHRIRTGNAADGVPAAFIDSAYNGSGLITDLIEYKNGNLVNITMDPKLGISNITSRLYAIYCDDIDGDGNIEIPSSTPMPLYDGDKTNEVFWGTSWWRYVPSKGLSEIAYTYNDLVDSWHFMLPISWKNQITVRRGVEIEGEHPLIFCCWNSKTKKFESLFTIYTITGEDRKRRAALKNRFTIMERQDVIFAGEISKNNFNNTPINQQFVKNCFKYSEEEWYSDQVVY